MSLREGLLGVAVDLRATVLAGCFFEHTRAYNENLAARGSLRATIISRCRFS